MESNLRSASKLLTDMWLHKDSYNFRVTIRPVCLYGHIWKIISEMSSYYWGHPGECPVMFNLSSGQPTYNWGGGVRAANNSIPPSGIPVGCVSV